MKKEPDFYTVAELQERWRLKTLKPVHETLDRHDDILQPVKIGGKWLVKSENVKKYEAKIRKVQVEK